MFLFFFFFQAEDGIRDYKVTGVQTCALPISITTTNISSYFFITRPRLASACGPFRHFKVCCSELDRKSTRLNSSHLVISYAVFCLKKKKKKNRVLYYTYNS